MNLLLWFFQLLFGASAPATPAVAVQPNPPAIIAHASTSAPTPSIVAPKAEVPSSMPSPSQLETLPPVLPSYQGKTAPDLDPNDVMTGSLRTINDAACPMMLVFWENRTTVDGQTVQFQVCHQDRTTGWVQPASYLTDCALFYGDGSWTNESYSGDPTSITCGNGGFTQVVNPNVLP